MKKAAQPAKPRAATSSKPAKKKVASKRNKAEHGLLFSNPLAPSSEDRAFVSFDDVYSVSDEACHASRLAHAFTERARESKDVTDEALAFVATALWHIETERARQRILSERGTSNTLQLSAEELKPLTQAAEDFLEKHGTFFDLFVLKEIPPGPLRSRLSGRRAAGTRDELAGKKVGFERRASLAGAKGRGNHGT